MRDKEAKLEEVTGLLGAQEEGKLISRVQKADEKKVNETNIPETDEETSQLFELTEDASGTKITQRCFLCSEACVAILLVGALILSALAEIIYNGVVHEPATATHTNSTEGLTDLLSQSYDNRTCLKPEFVDGGLTGGLCSSVFLHYKKLNRTIQFLANGVETFTYSDDQIAMKEVEAHVRMMKHMTAMGHKIHQHDPLFRKMFAKEWASKIDLEYEVIEGGIRVKQTSTDDCAIQLIKYHAVAVSRFVEEGIPEFLCEHEIPSCAS